MLPVELATPSAVVDRDVLDANLDRATARVARLGARWRPHAKTHRAVSIARRQLRRGAVGLTVATLNEAIGLEQAFPLRGRLARDVFWAFPLIVSEAARAVDTAIRTEALRLAVDDRRAVRALQRALDNVPGSQFVGRGLPIRVRVEIDAGYGRSGVPADDVAGVRALIEAIGGDRRLRFDGLFTHEGDAYQPGCARGAAVAARDALVNARDASADLAPGDPIPISLGSTPSLAAMAAEPEAFAGTIDEIRSGNDVFYDLTQVALGSCAMDDLAFTVLASVVSARPGRRAAVIDAGALALSKDRTPETFAWNGAHHGAIHGLVLPGDAWTADGAPIAVTRGGWPIRRLSQEHGWLELADAGDSGASVDAARALPVGSRVRVRPAHSCLAAACFTRYVYLKRFANDVTRVVGWWPTCGRR
ncbi:MAG: alanine racemase [Acidobacteriota bacterium]